MNMQLQTTFFIILKVFIEEMGSKLHPHYCAFLPLNRQSFMHYMLEFNIGPSSSELVPSFHFNVSKV